MKQDIILGKVWAQKSGKSKSSCIQCTIPRDFASDLGIEGGNTIAFTRTEKGILMTKVDLENL
jgi:hypothetical protein